MKAVVINRYGSSDVLEYREDVHEPACGANQVVIKVKAASINPLDIKTRSGELRFILRSRFPLILGSDVSGTIVRLGNEVEGFSVGDDVFCMLDAHVKPALNGFAQSGGYAEYAVTRVDTLCIKPHGITHIEAAAVPLAALTAYQALVHVAKIEAGQRVLINGASGGVGTFAIQIAKALGAEVVAVCSERNQELAMNLGADFVLNYQRVDFTKNNNKYDVIYDVVANKTFSECTGSLSDSGILISNIASLKSFLFPYIYPLVRIFGSRKQFRHAWVKPSGKDLQSIKNLIEIKKIKPVIGSTFSLNQAGLAHNSGTGKNGFGKIVFDLEMHG